MMQHCRYGFVYVTERCLFMQVGDFGLSKIKRNTLVSGGVRGTLPWMAPELLSGSSSKVSVFSSGIYTLEASQKKRKNPFDVKLELVFSYVL